MSTHKNTNSLPMKVVEELTKKLDIPDNIYNEATEKYIEVANFLGESENPLLQDVEIYPQGSIRLKTVVRPNGVEEFDIDLVIHLPNASKEHSSEYIYNIIGDRLKEEESPYKNICEPKNRCWTLNFKSQFHMDITPAIANPFVSAEEFEYTDTAELVPDKKLSKWKDSNPRGFAQWFDDISQKMPIFVIRKAKGFDTQISAESIMESFTIEDIPDNNEYKGLLRRSVQLLKKNRDYYFSERKPDYSDFKPISIVITTLAAKSYRRIIDERIEYSCPFEMMKDIVKGMGSFIKVENQYKVVNPTNENENFAEKWNTNNKYADAFILWQKAAYEELEELQQHNGLHEVGNILEKSYGKNCAMDTIKELTNQVNIGRENNILTAGIITSTTATSSAKANTFFGS